LSSSRPLFPSQPILGKGCATSDSAPPHFVLLFLLCNIEPERKKPLTPTDANDDDSYNVTPTHTPLPVDETTGNLSFGIRKSRQIPNGVPYLPLHLLSRITAPLLAIFVIGIIAVSPLGMSLLRLKKIHHRDIALVAMVTILFALVAIGALYVSYHLTDTEREVLSAFPLALCLSSHLSFSFLVDQRDDHGTEHNKNREIFAANAVTGFRHCLLQKDLPTGFIN
jgi:hypothetical protein